MALKNAGRFLQKEAYNAHFHTTARISHVLRLKKVHHFSHTAQLFRTVSPLCLKRCFSSRLLEAPHFLTAQSPLISQPAPLLLNKLLVTIYANI